MKDWCKHKFGYVNFDDTHLYFTSTGNWSDTKDLGLFNDENTKRSSSAERYKSMGYLAFASIIIVCALWTFGFSSFGYVSILGLAWLAYSAYNYMAPGLTDEFKVPYSDISNIEIKDTLVKITFIDSKGEECMQELADLDQKGVDLFLYISLSC